MILIGNWKMAPDTEIEALALAKETALAAKKAKFPVVILPPALYINAIQKKTKLAVGGQSISPFADMPHTGDISATMLKKAGAAYALIGHSERRASNIETNATVAEAALRAYEKKLIPIICIGEKDRDAGGTYLGFVKSQIETAVSQIPKAKIKDVIFAYEPVWAIGAAAVRPATVTECREMMIFIRKVLADITGDTKISKKAVILYGGGVYEENAKEFTTEGEASGLLVGRVSTEIKKFSKLIQAIS